ncbi:MAG: SIR2 family protein [Lutisporaceae bacterium]
MREATIDEIAYEIKSAKNNKQNKPIVFLGAGASRTGNIPLAREIVDDILCDYKESPRIKNLPEDQRTYSQLMECLSPFERNNLLKRYVDNAKINVTHIYLAQLLKEGYIDYVLTVNFNNLMLRALSLYNIFPHTYDMAILKDLTTTTFDEKSIVYLHGQHHGLWLLNTDEEMEKVDKVITTILNKISDRRAWIFIGYSGEDPIFKHIVKLGRFDNGLYWVAYKDTIPNKNVCEDLLEKGNTNSYIVKSYDADSFMVKLCSKLELNQPDIIDKPFTMLSKLLQDIVDINEEDHYKGVKQRLEIVKKQVGKAIEQFEDGKFDTSEKEKNDTEKDLIKKELIQIIIENNFIENDFIEEKIKLVEKKVKDSNIKSVEIDNLFTNIHNNWGNAISDLAKQKKDEKLYLESFEKYEKATKINPKNDSAFYNWGIAISDLAKQKEDEKLYLESFEKYEKATKINPKNDSAFYNWGIAIYDLAKQKEDEKLYLESFEKYEEATKINPKYDRAFYNWGIAIYDLAKQKKDEKLYLESIEKLKIAFDLEGSSYNLACLYAQKNNKEEALKHLDICLQKNIIDVEYVEKDPDWSNYEHDAEFIKIVNMYREKNTTL